MNLIWITGPPAVGKMTVGIALSKLTGLPLLHNHATIELVLPIFPFGSPPFTRLVESFRRQIFEEVAKSEHQGLISTTMISFDKPEQLQHMAERNHIFEKHGARVCWVELFCDLDERLRRNKTELRLLHKASKRDVDASEGRLLRNERFMLNSADQVPFPNDWLKINNTNLSPEEVARQIMTHFDLPTKESMTD